MSAAAWWFRHQTARLIRELRDPRWKLVLAVAPDTAQQSRAWPADLARWPQGKGDLGARMGRMLRRAGGPVCVIGADIPGIRKRHIARAFRMLGAHDAVFGPAHDGGYWLIGLRRGRPLPAGIFAGVRWSTRHALADTRASLSGHRIALINTLRDVDTADDLP